MEDEESEKGIDINYDLYDYECESKDDDDMFNHNIDHNVDYAVMDFDAFMENAFEINSKKDGNSNYLQWS